MSNRDRLPIAVTHQVRDTCLCLHLQRAARAVARRFDEALRPLGLTSGQFSLLMSLNRPEPPTIGRVAGVLAMDRTTLTANLKPLERRGLVEDPASMPPTGAAAGWCRPGRAIHCWSGRFRCGSGPKRRLKTFLASRIRIQSAMTCASCPGQDPSQPGITQTPRRRGILRSSIAVARAA